MCVAECNCGCVCSSLHQCLSRRGSGVQLEGHWLCSRTDEQHNTEIWTECRSLTLALIAEEDVFCFKFVSFCFKQNSEQYRHLNVTYIDGRKTNFPFKMVPKEDAAYLEFQTHTSGYSISQSTVHVTRDNYCSPLPHKHSRSVVQSANTVPLTAA